MVWVFYEKLGDIIMNEPKYGLSHVKPNELEQQMIDD